MIRSRLFHLLWLAACIGAALADLDSTFNPITKPVSNDRIFAGQYFDIKWINNTPDPISLLLFFWGTNQNWILADNIPNTGVYHWWVSDQIAYPTLVDTIYAGDPNWFEIHIYNGSFRNTIGPGANSYIGNADALMKMNVGGLWFNITAPMYSVQINSVVTVNPTSFSTITGGTTETFPITWSTVPSPRDGPTGSSAVTPGVAAGSRTSTTRIPTFASINGGMSSWRWSFEGPWIGWVLLTVAVGGLAIL